MASYGISIWYAYDCEKIFFQERPFPKELPLPEKGTLRNMFNRPFGQAIVEFENESEAEAWWQKASSMSHHCELYWFGLDKNKSSRESIGDFSHAEAVARQLEIDAGNL